MYILFITWYFVLPLNGTVLHVQIAQCLEARGNSIKILLAKGMEITLFVFQGSRNLRQSSEMHKNKRYWLQQLLICPVLKYIIE